MRLDADEELSFLAVCLNIESVPHPFKRLLAPSNTSFQPLSVNDQKLRHFVVEWTVSGANYLFKNARYHAPFDPFRMAT